MGTLKEFQHSPSGVRAWFEFNDNNLRITAAHWSNPSSENVRIQLRVAGGASLLNHTGAGFSTGSTNINSLGIILITVVDTELGNYFEIPLTHNYNMEWG